jgi:hypothetical protein
MVFSLKNSLFALALAATTSAQGGQGGLRNISDSCRQAMRSTFRPTTADCNIGKSTAEKDKFCGNMDKCVQWAKQTIQDGCKEEANMPRIKFTLDFGIPLNYKGKCIKDSKNAYCKITRNETAQCDDCHPKYREMMTSILGAAPQDMREKIFGWHDKRNPCNGTEKNNPLPPRGGNNATRDTNSNNRGPAGTTQNVSGSSALSVTNLVFYASALVSSLYAVNAFL